MARGKRKFVVEITETSEITVDQITQALARLSNRLHRGVSPLEGGVLNDQSGHKIGTYKWLDQFAVMPGTEARH